MTHPRPDLALATAQFVAFDCETTGMDPRRDQIVALGAVRFTADGGISDTFESLVDPGLPIPHTAVAVHGIDDAAVRGQPHIAAIVPSFRSFVGAAVPVAHMAAFDLAFLRGPLRRARQPSLERVLDTAVLASRLLPTLSDISLEGLGARLAVPITGRHTAIGDATTAARLCARLLVLLERRGTRTLHQALDWGDAGRAIV